MKTLAIAAITIREMLRRKVQVSLVVFGVALVLATYVVSLLTLGEMRRIIADLGLTSMELIATLLAVFLGSTIIAGDVERKVVQPIAAKPVSRTEYVLGRYAGLSVVLGLNVALMGAALAAVLTVDARSFEPLNATLGAAVIFIATQAFVVAAVSVLFSCITSGTLAAIFSLSTALAGHLTNDMRSFWQGGATWVRDVVWYLLPNLGALSLNEAVLYRTPVGVHAWSAAAYAVLYAAAAIALGTALFERRDFQ